MSGKLSKQKSYKNKRKFGNCEELPNGGRRYWYDVAGSVGWFARYIKEVNAQEQTIRFYQEIHNGKGALIEIHEKYPVDKGHQKVTEE